MTQNKNQTGPNCHRRTKWLGVGHLCNSARGTDPARRIVTLTPLGVLYVREIRAERMRHVGL